MSSIGGTGQGGWNPAFWGTTADGQDMTVSFGQGKNEGETLLADGHVASKSALDKNHDHYDGNGGGTQRGAYTGRGSSHRHRGGRRDLRLHLDVSPPDRRES